MEGWEGLRVKGFRDVLYCTMNKGSKAMSKVLKVVFAAFTQHFIQSNGTHVTHVGGVESVLYSIYKAPYPFKREGYLKSL